MFRLQDRQFLQCLSFLGETSAQFFLILQRFQLFLLFFNPILFLHELFELGPTPRLAFPASLPLLCILLFLFDLRYSQTFLSLPDLVLNRRERLLLLVAIVFLDPVEEAVR